MNAEPEARLVLKLFLTKSILMANRMYQKLQNNLVLTDSLNNLRLYIHQHMKFGYILHCRATKAQAD